MAKHGASMKVPALRRGNLLHADVSPVEYARLNESPRPKAGKFYASTLAPRDIHCLNESPRPKAGKSLPRSRSFCTLPLPQ